jgi:hypothetical protein
LRVVTLVVNRSGVARAVAAVDGGTSTAARSRGAKRAPENFINLITGTPVTSGTPYFRGKKIPGLTRTVDPGSYAVYQTKRRGYSRTYSRSCSGTIAAGQTRTCVVINRQRALPAARVYDLAISRTISKRLLQGGPTIWKLVVTNLGRATAPGVRVVTTLPPGFRLETAEGGRCSTQPGTLFPGRMVTCQLGTMPKGAQRTTLLTVRAPRSTETARSLSGVIGTGLEVRYLNNIVRTRLLVTKRLVVTTKPKTCAPGSRLYNGTCHPIVAGQG